MDFSLTESQQELQDLARRILADRLTLAHLKAVERSSEAFDRETWAELARANLLGVAVPEAHGGLGFGLLDLCLVLQEVGRHVAPVPAVPCLVSAALPIARFGSVHQQEVLSRVATGEAVVTAALSEIGTPSDVPITRATRDGDGWRLDGAKTGVPFAHVAETILVPAAVDAGVGVFLVPADAPGLGLERQQTINFEPHCHLTLDGVRVGPDDLLGDPGSGAEILAWTLDRTMVGLCAVVSGAADRALRMTAQYSCDRHQFDRPIGTFQAVGQRLADAFIDDQAIELTMLQAATHLDEGRDVPDEVAIAKFWACDGGSRIGHAALHVHAGISIDVDYPIHRYFLWIKQAEFTLGAATPQLVRLGRMLAAERA